LTCIIVECVEGPPDPKIRSITSCAFFDSYTETFIAAQQIEVICLKVTTLNWCCSVNCEAELLVIGSLTRGIQNQLRQEPL